mgnify:CR=1 FL=1
MVLRERGLPVDPLLRADEADGERTWQGCGPGRRWRHGGRIANPGPKRQRELRPSCPPMLLRLCRSPEQAPKKIDSLLCGGIIPPMVVKFLQEEAWHLSVS